MQVLETRRREGERSDRSWRISFCIAIAPKYSPAQSRVFTAE